jgi:hypothetical protein
MICYRLYADMMAGDVLILEYERTDSGEEVTTRIQKLSSEEWRSFHRECHAKNSPGFGEVSVRREDYTRLFDEVLPWSVMVIKARIPDIAETELGRR